MHHNPSTYSSPINTNLQFPEHEHLNCPRCDSDNTKFCYYNNYNLSQPRHYCKNCRRYWTKGGTLRKVPIGGGTRKTTKRSSTSNKRSPISSTAIAPAARLKPESSASVDFNNNNNDNRSGIFGGSFDFNSQLGDGSEKNDLNKCAEVMDPNLTPNGKSSGCDGGNGWPNLSIFTSGSKFH